MHFVRGKRLVCPEAKGKFSGKVRNHCSSVYRTKSAVCKIQELIRYFNIFPWTSRVVVEVWLCCQFSWKMEKKHRCITRVDIFSVENVHWFHTDNAVCRFCLSDSFVINSDITWLCSTQQSTTVWPSTPLGFQEELKHVIHCWMRECGVGGHMGNNEFYMNIIEMATVHLNLYFLSFAMHSVWGLIPVSLESGHSLNRHRSLCKKMNGYPL